MHILHHSVTEKINITNDIALVSSEFLKTEMQNRNFSEI